MQQCVFITHSVLEPEAAQKSVYFQRNNVFRGLTLDEHTAVDDVTAGQMAPAFCRLVGHFLFCHNPLLVRAFEMVVDGRRTLTSGHEYM